MEFTIEALINQEFKEFIGSFNIILKLHNKWYQIPFAILWEECIIPYETKPNKVTNNLEVIVLIETISCELLSRWEYFEYALYQYKIK